MFENGQRFIRDVADEKSADDGLGEPREKGHAEMQIVDDLDAYQTVPDIEDRTGHRARMLEEGADLVTFTSSSTVANFCNLVDVAVLRA